MEKVEETLKEYSLNRIERIKENNILMAENQREMFKEIVRLNRIEILTKKLIQEYQTHSVMLPDTIDKINELIEEGKR